MPHDFNDLDKRSLNKLFLQLSRQFRQEIKAGKPSHELAALHTKLSAVHEALKNKQFHCLTTNRNF